MRSLAAFLFCFWSFSVFAYSDTVTLSCVGETKAQSYYFNEPERNGPPEFEDWKITVKFSEKKGVFWGYPMFFSPGCDDDPSEHVENLYCRPTVSEGRVEIESGYELKRDNNLYLSSTFFIDRYTGVGKLLRTGLFEGAMFEWEGHFNCSKIDKKAF